MNETELRRQTWETYASAWQATGAEAKALALRASVDGDCVYRDPLATAEGHAALIESARACATATRPTSRSTAPTTTPPRRVRGSTTRSPMTDARLA